MIGMVADQQVGSMTEERTRHVLRHGKNIYTQLMVAGSLMAVLSLSACEGGPSSGEEFQYQHAVAKLNEKAQQYITAGDNLAAVARLEAALDLLPNEVQTMNNLAIAYHSAERYEQAIDIYEKMISADAANAGLYHKSAGISYEALADKELHSISEANLPAGSKQEKETQKIAIENYKKSILHYQEAIDHPNGLKPSDTDPGTAESLPNQIKAVKNQIIRVESGKL